MWREKRGGGEGRERFFLCFANKGGDGEMFNEPVNHVTPKLLTAFHTETVRLQLGRKGPELNMKKKKKTDSNTCGDRYFTVPNKFWRLADSVVVQ